MNEYLFYTPEGQTIPPDASREVENCQVLGRARGRTLAEAKTALLQDNPWIVESGFDPARILAAKLGD